MQTKKCKIFHEYFYIIVIFFIDYNDSIFNTLDYIKQIVRINFTSLFF